MSGDMAARAMHYSQLRPPPCSSAAVVGGHAVGVSAAGAIPDRAVHPWYKCSSLTGRRHTEPDGLTGAAPVDVMMLRGGSATARGRTGLPLGRGKNRHRILAASATGVDRAWNAACCGRPQRADHRRCGLPPNSHGQRRRAAVSPSTPPGLCHRQSANGAVIAIRLGCQTNLFRRHPRWQAGLLNRYCSRAQATLGLQIHGTP